MVSQCGGPVQSIQGFVVDRVELAGFWANTSVFLCQPTPVTDEKTVCLTVHPHDVMYMHSYRKINILLLFS